MVGTTFHREIVKLLPNEKISHISLNELIVDSSSLLRGKDIYSALDFLTKVSLFRLENTILKGERKIEIDDGILKSKGIEYLKSMNNIPIKEWPVGFYEIINELCDGLNLVFKTLFCPNFSLEKLNRMTSDDREFWKSCKNIFLYSVFFQGNIGIYIEEKLNRDIHKIGIDCKVNIIISKIEPGLLGCALVFGKNAPVLLYDFGSSRIKKGVRQYKDGNEKIEECSCIDTSVFIGKKSLEMHQFICDMVISDIGVYGLYNVPQIFISICISNNIVSGIISTRGIYASLSNIPGRYDDYLKKELSYRLNRDIIVSIINDVYAVARLYEEYSPNAAVITLGTHMGIAYPF